MLQRIARPALLILVPALAGGCLETAAESPGWQPKEAASLDELSPPDPGVAGKAPGTPQDTPDEPPGTKPPAAAQDSADAVFAQQPVGWNPRLPAVFRTGRGQSLIQRFGPRLQLFPDGKIRRFLHVPASMGTVLAGLIQNRWLPEDLGAENPAGNLIEVVEGADKVWFKNPASAQTAAWGGEARSIADWIVITAPEAVQSEVDRWLRVWWTGRDHVEIRAVIIESDRLENEDYGAITSLQALDADLFVQGYLSEFPNTADGGGTLALRAIRDEFEFAATLQFLQSTGSVSIRSVPSIVTRAGIAAQIANRTRIPYQQADRIEPSGNLRLKIGWAETGVKMNVMPVVSGLDKITLNIEIDVASLNTTLVNPDIPAPVIRNTLIRTNPQLREGQSLWIGGLKSELTREVETGTPILMDIPLLGWLFRSTFNERQETEVIFILTPEIRRFQGSLPEVEEIGDDAFDDLFNALGEDDG